MGQVGMGQVKSETVSTQNSQVNVEDRRESSSPPSTSSPKENPSPPSLDSLIAVPGGKAQKALECPCIAHLRSGPCGSQFSDAFLCFLKSTAEEKGSHCVNPFVVLQSCIKENPNAFSKDILEDDEIQKEEKSVQKYKIHPPVWSVETKAAD